MTRQNQLLARLLAVVATPVVIGSHAAQEATLSRTIAGLWAPAVTPSLERADHSVPAATKPSLIVLIAIDQFRADYLTRWAPQLTGGLARLMKSGAVFTDAHQDHGITETAPGHATMLSGRFPRSTGIMMNSIGVDDQSAPLIVSAN